MEEQLILDEIQEIEESLEWCSPEAKDWHRERLRDAKRRLAELKKVSTSK